jgi:hypothetical protein
MVDIISTAPKDSYWAAEADPEKLVGYLVERRHRHERHIVTSGLYNRIARNWRYYHGLYTVEDGSSMAIKSGDDDLTSAIANVNHFRSLVDQRITYIVQNKPAWDTRALNHNTNTRNKTILFNELLDAYMEIGGCEEYLRRMVFHGDLFAQGFFYVTWDESAGKALRPDMSGQMINEGDIKVRNPSVFDISWDYQHQDWNEIPWIQIRVRYPRWDLVALYPELQDDIIDAPRSGVTAGKYSSELPEIGTSHELTDLVDVYHFWHKATPAMPEGMFMSYFSDKTPLDQPGPNPYQILPLARYAPGEYALTSFGYTSAFDQQVPQEWMAANISARLTALNTLAHPLIHSEDQNPPVIEELSPQSGIDVVRCKGRLEVLPLFQQGTAGLEEDLALSIQQQNYMAGVGPVSRGQPEGELKGASGAAFAMLDSKSMQAATVSRQRYDEARSRAGTILLKVFKVHAKSPRINAMAGLKNQKRLLEWSAEDLKDLDYVSVDSGNPLQRSISGRLQLADSLMAQNLLTTKQEYMEVIRTGDIDPLTDAVEAQNSRVGEENETFLKNIDANKELIMALKNANDMMDREIVKMVLQQLGVVCLKTDNHILHLRRNSAILDTTEACLNPGLNVPVTAHLQQHLDFMADPEVIRQQLLLGYIDVEQFKSLMDSLQVPALAAGMGMGMQGGMPRAGGAPGMAPAGAEGPAAKTMDPNSPGPDQPQSALSTGQQPKAPQIPKKAVNTAISQGAM